MNVFEWNNPRYLAASSILFVVPSVYAYCRALYLPSLGFTLCTMASINHWKDPQQGIRRTIDRVLSRTCSTVGILHFMANSTPLPRCIFLIGTSVMGGLYLLSLDRGIRGQPWIQYHVLLHVSAMLNGMYYVYSLSKIV
jgi:hypothetical protein